MKQDYNDIILLFKNYYGLSDYIFPKESALKAIIFYGTSDEREILDKNNIYHLGPECSKNEIVDVFTNKVLTEEYIGLHISDIQINLLFNEFGIKSLFIINDPTPQKVFEIGSLDLGSPIKLSPGEEDRLKSLFTQKLIKFKSISISDTLIMASIDKDFIFNETNIKPFLETNYNIMNIFDEENSIISKMVENYARSKR